MCVPYEVRVILVLTHGKDHYGQSLLGNKDMQEALQRLRSLTALEDRAISSETRVDVAESRQIAQLLRVELGAMKLGGCSNICEVIPESDVSSPNPRLAYSEHHRT